MRNRPVSVSLQWLVKALVGLRGWCGESPCVCVPAVVGGGVGGVAAVVWQTALCLCPFSGWRRRWWGCGGGAGNHCVSVSLQWLEEVLVGLQRWCGKPLCMCPCGDWWRRWRGFGGGVGNRRVSVSLGETIARAATPEQKSQIKLAISPSHMTLTPDQPA